MLMEGSSFGRLEPDHVFPTEYEVEQQFVGLFREIGGLALVCASAQNIDRMVGIYRACQRSARKLIIDLYTAEILRATGDVDIPQSDWPEVAIYIPQYQRSQIKKSGRFDLLDPYRSRRIFEGELKALAPRAAMLFRHAMLRDLDQADSLSGVQVVWSQWDGYLEDERGKALLADLAIRNIPLVHAHTSGHASVTDLKRLAEAVSPRMLVPIHTFHPEKFLEHFKAVSLKNDGEWWDVMA
jgi:ribonuclease J